MKKPTLLLSALSALSVQADARWFELRCSPSHPLTNYALPAGKVLQLMAFDAPPKSATFTAVRPEGTISQAEISNDVSAGAYIIGPGTISFFWTGTVSPQYGFHLLTCREFDADDKPTVRVSLEASTNLPSFQPAGVFFRAKTE